MHIFVRPYSLLLAGHFQLQSKKKASLQPLLALLRVVVAAVDTGRRRLHKLGNEVDRNRKNDGRVLLCRDGTESLESPMSSTQYIVYIILWYKLKRQRKQQKKKITFFTGIPYTKFMFFTPTGKNFHPAFFELKYMYRHRPPLFSIKRPKFPLFNFLKKGETFFLLF